MGLGEAGRGTIGEAVLDPEGSGFVDGVSDDGDDFPLSEPHVVCSCAV